MTNCQGCHGVNGAGTMIAPNVQGASASAIQTAIDTNAGGMGSLSSLTPAEVQAIADFLQGPF